MKQLKWVTNAPPDDIEGHQEWCRREYAWETVVGEPEGSVGRNLGQVLIGGVAREAVGGCTVEYLKSIGYIGLYREVDEDIE